MARLRRSLFAGDTAFAARALLGCRLVRVLPSGERLSGRIVETEAYPTGDPSSHAFRGPTPRASVMFGTPGTAYVYRIYGVHWCLNVVTEPEGAGAAILIRGLDGIEGCAGPSLLCRRLEIDGTLNRLDMLAPASPLRLASVGAPLEPVVTTTRIGLTRAADWPMRYYLLGSPGVSRRDRKAEVAL